MHDAAAALRPIHEAADAIRRLQEYERPEELTSAIATVWDAVERSLRLRLRADADAPDDERLSALSQERMVEQVVQSLRQRDRISLRLAGAVHELRLAAQRAVDGGARPADADVALRAVVRLREELSPDPTTAVPTPPAPGGTPTPGAPRPGPTAALAARSGDGEDGVPPERRGRWIAWLAAALAAVALVIFGWTMLRGGEVEHEAAITAFRAGRLDSAAAAFERVLEDRPEDVSAMLYLGRIYRRQQRRAEAADVLGRAARTAPADADVRRELGHLFMDLRRPEAAAAQYQQAVEHEPDEAGNWIALIGALRAADDPRAESMLERAPAEAQAALGGGATPR